MIDTSTPILSVRDLKIEFGHGPGLVKAVDGIDLDIHPGETVALVGESGSGKSVTAMSLARLNPEPAARYTSGSILFDGRSILTCSEKQLQSLRGSSISYVFQDPTGSLNPVLTVGHQIREALKLHRKDIQAKEEAIRLLDIVGIPDAHRRVHSYPHELSGGMQQRVMIAMALACRPRLLVADEPTTALDVTIQEQILRLLNRLQKRFDMSILFITHNLALVSEIADRVYVMRNGDIVEEGNTHDVLSAPKHPYTQELIDAVPRMDTDTAAQANQSEYTSGTFLEVEDLHLAFSKGQDKVQALDGITLDIKVGQCIGLVGESGCGKTTLGRCILGMVQPDTGEVRYKGGPISTYNKVWRQDYCTEVQMVFQDPYGSLNPRMTIGSVLMEVMKVHKIDNSMNLYNRAAELLQLVGLEPSHLNRYPHEFSGGQRQRIVIARALAVEPSVLIADEPVSALDVSIQAQILDLLKKLQTKLNLTILFISHDLAVVRNICDYVHVMYQGKIVESGAPKTIYSNPQHDYTKKLLDAVPTLTV